LAENDKRWSSHCDKQERRRLHNHTLMVEVTVRGHKVVCKDDY